MWFLGTCTSELRFLAIDTKMNDQAVEITGSIDCSGAISRFMTKIIVNLPPCIPIEIELMTIRASKKF